MLTLLKFGKILAENVIALIADNSEKNKALVDLCEVPLIGCSSVVEEVDSHDVADFASAALAKRLKQAPLLKYVSRKFLLPTVGYFWIGILCKRKARSKMDRKF